MLSRYIALLGEQMIWFVKSKCLCPPMRMWQHVVARRENAARVFFSCRSIENINYLNFSGA